MEVGNADRATRPRRLVHSTTRSRGNFCKLKIGTNDHAKAPRLGRTPLHWSAVWRNSHLRIHEPRRTRCESGEYAYRVVRDRAGSAHPTIATNCADHGHGNLSERRFLHFALSKASDRVSGSPARRISTATDSPGFSLFNTRSISSRSATFWPFTLATRGCRGAWSASLAVLRGCHNTHPASHLCPKSCSRHGERSMLFHAVFGAGIGGDEMRK